MQPSQSVCASHPCVLPAPPLQDALACSTVDTAAQVQSDVVFHAGRIEALLREFMASPEAAGAAFGPQFFLGSLFLAFQEEGGTS